MIETFKKHIYKQDKIQNIFDRSKDFYNISKKSKYFLFPEAIKIDNENIVYEKIDFKKYTSWYITELDVNRVIFLAQALWEFYVKNSDAENINIHQKQTLHGDVHLGNIFFPRESHTKILFIDPETPNSLEYDIFTYNTVAFEIAYMLYHLDNHWPIWNINFYKNNIFFKNNFLIELEKSIVQQDIVTWRDDIMRNYKDHIFRKFVFSYNPILLIHRVLRFVIIYSKFLLWVKYLKSYKK